MPLMRMPQAAGAGEGLGGHHGSHKLPTPGSLWKWTLETRNGKDREGTARSGTVLSQSLPLGTSSLWDPKM